VKAKLEDLEKRCTIVKETASTDWISNICMVVVAKPKKMRICLDPQELNKVIQHPEYQMPALEEVLLGVVQSQDIQQARSKRRLS